MRFSDATGAEIPRWIRLRLQAYGDDADLDPRLRSWTWSLRLCEQLRDQGAPGLALLYDEPERCYLGAV